ncbi:type II toxin-antitoxin system prevent-host-death family antitoxin [Microbacterium invictum]|uniref:Antitoxin n=1 Tax=Microbacterium invictum TaxID=515415 RepID=A0AA40SRB7_9MICO|nr:type II toxin-antitoxin system prevent-host-death family antitoxin [Microbacterium invictum]MBB4140861.1 prevent-host-death family protein [Microbacterium invictum]
MSTVSAYEAKTHLSALLERADAGESITITKHGRPVARLVPIDARRDTRDLLEDVRTFRDGLGDEPVDVRALVDEGRRY